ncbi:UTR5B [Symbiodinium necroappetens]|uniref:UTR5B protein n=1 Tax=Symbiodinium necroappetens TaxID=1628268 RepID=A0A813CGR0_9DINO|nr:UTR5B [Symbiodinium necroappetens]
MLLPWKWVRNTISQSRNVFMLAFYGCGIVGMLAVYGILQERIMTVRYDDEMFRHSVFLVLCNRLVAVLFAAVLASMHKESLANNAPLRLYLIVSLSNVIASTCQYEALKHVSFVVQMLGKSFKTIPVMMWGMVVSGKRYSLTDWLLAAVVTAGITIFLISGPHRAPGEGTGCSTLAGLALLSGFLALDGLTSVMEEKLFKDYETSKWNQILYVNLLSSTTSAAALVVSGEFMPALSFSRHAAFLRDASFLSLSAVAAQYFIYSQIREFGAVVFALTMNIRQAGWVEGYCLSSPVSVQGSVV